jgi:hypothetical protein
MPRGAVMHALVDFTLHAAEHYLTAVCYDPDSSLHFKNLLGRCTQDRMLSPQRHVPGD